VKRPVLLLCAAALVATGVSAQQPENDKRRTNAVPLTQVMIEGQRIAGDDVLMHKGTAYISVPALVEALGGSLARQGNAAIITIPADGSDRAATKLSEAYRKAAVNIPDTIEILRTLVYKHAPEVLAPRLDALDHEISATQNRVQTDADKSVYYALNNASNMLAIAYYKMMQGVPAETAKQDQIDSVLCSMESKFALQVGRLSGRESCSVFVRARQRTEAGDAP